jgi:ATP-dependent RNA helicase DDX46/PRP5
MPKQPWQKRVLLQQLLLSKGTSSDAGAIGATAAVGNHFSDELEINDYPIQARRKVTNKNALDEITERTGAAIISRGSFVPAGKKPEVGEKKLFLLIEGRSELSVRQAKLEIQRALEEETIKIASSTTSSGGGRYSVV